MADINKVPTTAPILRIETGMHTACGRRISTDAEGKFLLTCSDDKTARFWDASTGTLLKTFRIPIGGTNEGKIYCCSLTHDGKIAAFGGWTGYEWEDAQCIYLVNTQTGVIFHRIKGLPQVINDLEFSPDDRWLAGCLGSNDERIGAIIFNTGDWSVFKKLEDFDDDVSNVAFKPGGGLATGSAGGFLKMYNSDFEILAEENKLSGKAIFSLAFNHDGNLLAVGYEDSAIVEVRDAADLSILYEPSIKEAEKVLGGFYTLSFSADGSKLFGGGFFRKEEEGDFSKFIIRCWMDGGKGTYTDLKLMNNTVMDIKPMPDGDMAVLGSFPDLAVINPPYDKAKWYLMAGNNDYSDHDKSQFRINDSGSMIGFTPVNEEALCFDVLQRKLVEKKSTDPGPEDTQTGIIVTNWQNNDKPAINSKKVSFLQEGEICQHVDISSSGQQIVLGTVWSLYLSDINAEIIWQTSLPDIAWAVNISGNEKVVAAALGDGTIRWYNMNDSKELLVFYLHDDNTRWVLFTPSGYYDASAGGEDLLGWHLNNGPDDAPDFFPASRFREQFYRPDVIDRIFETYNETEAINLANKKTKTAGADIQMKLPPVLTILSPESGSFVSKKTVTVSFSIKCPTDAALKTIYVLVDGRAATTGQESIINPETNEKKIDIEIPRKDCTITLLAENDNGTSPDANLFLKWKADEETQPETTLEATKSRGVGEEEESGNEKNVEIPNLYVLAIGISDYEKGDYKLKVAHKDANDFYNAMQKQAGKFYDKFEGKLLVNNDASKDNIIKGLEWIKKTTTSEDIAMIYFAGHGINNEDNFYFMLPVEADIENLRITCLNFTEIKQIQSKIKGKVIVFLDACHSGNINGADGNVMDVNGLSNLLTNTIGGAGAITFTSCTGKEKSLESPAWGNGAFTKALIEGLNDPKSVDEENKITYTALSLDITRNVKKLTEKKQQPTMNNGGATDFAIAMKIE